MAKKKRGLGRGLDALLPPEGVAVGGPGGQLTEVPLEWIKPGKYQPRVRFVAAALAELTASIKAQGVMQPVVLRPVDTKEKPGEPGIQYELIAGERRWRAAQEAGLRTIPAIVRSVEDHTAIAMSLIENIQREDLNPLEEAGALQRLIDEFNFTHQQVAEAVGRSRSAVSNILRLSHLAAPVAELLMNGDIDMGHARALLTLDAAGQIKVAATVIGKALNVRQTEALVSRYARSPHKPTRKPVTDADTDIRRLESNLSQSLGQPVQIRHTKAGKGKLMISYSSLDELDGLLARMGYRREGDQE